MSRLTLTGAGSTGAGVPFTPSDYSNLSLWLKADTGYALTGALVDTLTDQSSNAIVFAQAGGAGLQPTWGATSGKNSLPGITFDGTTDSMAATTAILSGITQYTAFYVARHNADGILISSTNDGFGDQTYLGLRVGRFGGVNGFGFGTYAQALGGWTLARTMYDGGLSGNANQFKMYNNGIQQTLSFDTYVVSPALPASATITLGQFTAGGFYFNGIFSEIIIYTRVLSGAECAAVEAYLTSKYGAF